MIRRPRGYVCIFVAFLLAKVSAEGTQGEEEEEERRQGGQEGERKEIKKEGKAEVRGERRKGWK